MPKVKSPAALADAFTRTKAKIDSRSIPTTLIEDGQVLYRSIDPAGTFTRLPKPAVGGHVSKTQANKLLIPADASIELGNRFSGISYSHAVPPAGGLYCVLQQQALVNESTHYSGKAPTWALTGRCVLRIRVMGRLMVADLSPHNPGAMRFFRELGKDIWDRVNDSTDCSVARGIGLAIAQSGHLKGIAVQTVRESDRSAEERGDNLVLFASPGAPPPQLYIESAEYVDKSGRRENFPVEFP